MSLKGNTIEIKERFLTQIANEYGFFKTTRDVFIARFAEKSASTPNKEVANNLKMKEYDLSRYLDTICSKFGFASNERGRKPKGQSPWEKAFKWLWNEKYNDFIKQEPSIDNKEAEVKIVIDWRQVCSKMLEKQRETQRLRSKATEMEYELNIYVPLQGLVERKFQQRRTGNIEAKQLNQLESEVIINTYQHDKFLQRFTEQNQCSRNRHTAIIGEAGAGKTTLLSKIASYIGEKTDNLFVFISLSNLKGQNLHKFILKEWLPEAMGISYPKLDTTSEIEKEFTKCFRQGSIWLLLDGIDEMTWDTPLYWIKSQLQNWLNQVRVVLTCRNNVWDASVNNGVTGFDIFKAQDFEQEQVNEFIEKWFERADDKQQGDLLKAKLKETGRERIRDLVRNPLRLSLLCQTFYVNKAELPETKAALYKRLISYFQEWKQLYPKNMETQQKLHKALGELALIGINSETKFRFRESVARETMGDTLFQLAHDINWLYLVDRDIQTDEPVFAFFHPNFQEYFAALAINDWHYFLHHVPHNPKQGTYRIFEQQWKEVILLWLGRDDVEKHHKDKFINELAYFNDGCQNSHYRFQALFLAAAGISEFKIYDRQADEIIKLITELSFGTFNSQDNKYFKFIYSIERGARSALLQTDLTKALKALKEILPKLKNYPVYSEVKSFIDKFSPQTVNLAQEMNINNFLSFFTEAISINTSEEDKRLRTIQKLKRSDPSNQQVVEALIDLVQNTQECHIFLQATKALKEISLINPQAKLSLAQLLKDTNKGYIRLEAAKIFAKTDTEQKDYITTTILDLLIKFDLKFISPSWEEYNEYTKSSYYSEFECLLAETAVNNLQAIEALIQLLSQDQDYRWRIPKILSKIASRNKEAIIKLEQLCRSEQENTTSLLAANSLLEIDPLNLCAIDTLNRIVEDAQNKGIRWLASEKLWQMGQGKTNVLNALIEKVCDSSLDWGRRNYTWEILCTKHDNNPDIIKPMINIMLDSNCNQEARYLAIKELEEIAVDNLSVREAFIRLMNTETDEDICRQAANSWIKINPDKQEAIDKAVNVLTTLLNSPNDYSRLRTAESLEKICPGNLNSIKTLIDLLLNSNKWEEQDSEDDDYFPSVVGTAADYLNKISNKEILIFTLRSLKQWVIHPDSAKDIRRRILCWEIIFNHARNISYPDFFEAWHDKYSPIHNLENQFKNIALKLKATDKTFPILLDAHALENETDTSAISQEICNQIYFTAFPDAEPPEVNNAAQLKRLIPRIKNQLQTQKLAFIFDNCQPNPELIAFCRKITDVVSIAWITDEPLEAPLQGFPPNQPNLLNAIQNWINEIE